MYYPYFRGRGEELNAIVQTAVALGNSGNIVPIIEPVRNNTGSFRKCATACHNNNVSLGIIINPQVGDLVNNNNGVLNLVSIANNAQCSIVPFHLVSSVTTGADISNFLSTCQNGDIGFVHFSEPNARPNVLRSLAPAATRSTHLFVDGGCSNSYINQIRAARRIIVRDGFNRRRRNADYPDTTPEFFSDLYSTYQAQGYDGFGDFLTIGVDYIDSRGQPYAIALHLTHEDNNRILCRHFVSTSNATPANRARKYAEALDSLHTFTQSSPRTFRGSNAVGEFLQDQSNRTNTSLGMMKRRSMRHHLEIMCNLV